MKTHDRTVGTLAAGLCVGLAACLLSGCASSSSSNRKVYDRYAELVAARNRIQQGEEAPAAKAGPARAEPAKPPASAKPAPAKPAPAKPAAAKPAPEAEPVGPAAPVQTPPAQAVAAPPPAVPAPAPVAVIAPAPAPAPVAAPVAVIAPAPAPEPTPVPVPAPVPAATPAPAPLPVPAPEPSLSGGTAYVLKVGDFVQITLRGIPTGDAIEDVIDENGMITLPLINEVQAAGTTPSELERSIRKIYLDQDIYRNITVTVVVPTRYYFVQGEVRAAGKFQILSATRVSQAIAGAGGYSEYASGRVIVKRGGKIIKDIRNARRLERTPEDDILLEADDIVEVKRSLW